MHNCGMWPFILNATLIYGKSGPSFSNRSQYTRHILIIIIIKTDLNKDIYAVSAQ